MYLSTRNHHSLLQRPHSLYENISRTTARMKIDDLIFAMSDDNNEFLEDTSTNNSSSSKCGSHESDEGCCVITPAVQDSQSIRRVKSTPNLLQIPSPIRNRKRSDDSAVGSAEESDLSDKSSSDNFTVSEPVERFMLNNAKPPQEDPPMTLTVGRLLRPPSVVVSDHDLCQEGYQTFITLDDLDAEFNQQKQRRRLSDCSTCSSLSFSDSDFPINTLQQEEETEEFHDGSVTKKTSRWRTIRTIVHQLTPFIQTYKKQRYLWVQLAGHQGNFKPGGQPGTILKKFCAKEKEAFEFLMKDELKPFVPQYYGIAHEVVENGGLLEFIQLEDLLGQFTYPCVMDCKLGVRTYLEEELLKAKEKPKLRKDMYDKMCQIDKGAPTMEEHNMRGVTKPRYMVWRETISTTSTFGFRIEGVRRSDGSSSKDYKTTRSEEQVKEAFNSFLDGFTHVIQQYLDRLYALKRALSKSQFFATHEVIGSSLLFVHDSTKASLWMIDFAKTFPLPEGISPISHDKPWSVGNHEDGYLIGLNNLIKIFEDMLKIEQQK